MSTIEAEDDVRWQLGEPSLSSRRNQLIAVLTFVVLHRSCLEISIDAAFKVYVTSIRRHLELERRREIFVMFFGFLAFFASDLGSVSAGSSQSLS